MDAVVASRQVVNVSERKSIGVAAFIECRDALVTEDPCYDGFPATCRGAGGPPYIDDALV